MECLTTDEIFNNPDLAKYCISFSPGQTIFLEGDDSQDLYILLAGDVEIFKGDKKIRDLTRKGSVFGEVSFFLGDRRTASVKAKSEVEVICIPKEKIMIFLEECPTARPEIIRHLAEWLTEATQVLHGLKELCDQLPDAVIVTDREGRILVWNSAAEKVYGRDWSTMHNTRVDEIYAEPEEYKNFLNQVKNHYSAREKVFDIQHPQKGQRCISTNFTVLYDGHHNFQGVLSLGRDVTAVRKMEKKYRRAFIWLVSAFILIGLLSVTIFLGYPYYSKGHQAKSLSQIELTNLLAKDYYLLNSWMTNLLGGENTEAIHRVMRQFFKIQQKAMLPYTGLVLLDRDKKVLNAYSTKADIFAGGMIGSSYGAIKFEGTEDSLHRVLTVYRTEKDHPMGKKGIEIAFELFKSDEFFGWLVFQMDMDSLKNIYHIDEQDIKKLQFDKP